MGHMTEGYGKLPVYQDIRIKKSSVWCPPSCLVRHHTACCVRFLANNSWVFAWLYCV
jgi:hypothetical protein